MKRILLVVSILILPLSATAAGIPVELYVSPNDDGAGGRTISVPRDAGQRTVAVWSNFQGAAAGSGAISVQDVLFRASGDIAIVGFTCALPACLVGNRSDPRTVAPFPSRELVFTAGDDTAASPGLTGSRKVGDLVIDVGAEPGQLALAGGTALDGNSAPGTLQIEELPNGGVLLVPEPAALLQTTLALAALVWLRRSRVRLR